MLLLTVAPPGGRVGRTHGEVTRGVRFGSTAVVMLNKCRRSAFLIQPVGRDGIAIPHHLRRDVQQLFMHCYRTRRRENRRFPVVIRAASKTSTQAEVILVRIEASFSLIRAVALTGRRTLR
jgi:hypothetical protein